MLHLKNTQQPVQSRRAFMVLNKQKLNSDEASPLPAPRGHRPQVEMRGC